MSKPKCAPGHTHTLALRHLTSLSWTTVIGYHRPCHAQTKKQMRLQTTCRNTRKYINSIPVHPGKSVRYVCGKGISTKGRRKQRNQEGCKFKHFRSDALVLLVAECTDPQNITCYISYMWIMLLYLL